jgi:hypothetical protein
MQGNAENSNNVISLFAARKAETPKEDAAEVKDEVEFSDAIRRNLENTNRLKKERLKANQLVLKSYRIKN